MALAAGGCQTFVGIDDVSGHLPHVDGEYLIGLERMSAGGPQKIRLRGTASIVDRTLTMSLNQLSATTGAMLSENAIDDVVFPEGATAVDFQLSIEIRPDATDPATPAADSQVSASMRMFLEGDYAICAKPTTGTLPTIGSIVVDTADPTPALAQFDVACDDL